MTLKTTNYSIFKANPKQVSYNPLKTQDLIEIMRRDGFPESLCISCYKEKGQLYINTGHHRLAAAEALGIPVWYVVEHKWPSRTLAGEATSSRNWPDAAVCKLYAKDGSADYQTLIDYAAKGLPIEAAATMLAGRLNGKKGIRKVLREGTFKVKSTEHIDEVLEVVGLLLPKFPEAGSVTFIKSVSAFLRLEGFSQVRFIECVQAQRKIEKCATAQQMMEQLDEMYNFRQRSRDNIAFRAKEALRSTRIDSMHAARKNQGANKKAA